MGISDWHMKVPVRGLSGKLGGVAVQAGPQAGLNAIPSRVIIDSGGRP